MSGVIYIIRNKLDEKYYLGSTKDFGRRKKEHLSELRGGYHHNMHLQNAYKKYGEDAFEFVVLYESKDIKLDEQLELNKLDKESTYNLSPHSVGGDMNKTHPNRGEIYKKISETKKAIGKKPPNRIQIKIDDQTYDSFNDASKSLDMPVVTVRYRCLSKNIRYQNWNIVGKEKDPSELYREGDKVGFDITCEGIDFPSCAEAGRYFELSVTAVLHRIKSENYPNWNKK